MFARRSTQMLCAGAMAGWLALAAHPGCMPDLDHLAAGNDEGSRSSSGGTTADGGGTRSETGGNGGGGAATHSGGMNTGGTNSHTSGAVTGSGGNGGSGGSGATSGMAGAGGVSCEDEGLASCPDESGCFDLTVGVLEDDTVTHCGACGLTCSLNNAISTECSEGQCQPTCESGFDDCNAELDAAQAEGAPPNDDGCETDITSADNCAACGYACSGAGATTTSCNDGRCAPTCLPIFGNCNAGETLATDDGCETYLESLTSCRADCSAEPVACDRTQVCTAGSCGDPQGIVVFSVPLTESGQIMRYSDIFPTGTDLVGATVYVRMYAPSATEGKLVSYFSTFDSAFGGGANFPLSYFAAGWKEIGIPVGNATGNYDPTQIKQLNFEIQADNASAWEPTPVLIYIDALRSSNGSVNETFDADYGGMVPSSFLVIEGATLEWTDSLPE